MSVGALVGLIAIVLMVTVLSLPVLPALVRKSLSAERRYPPPPPHPNTDRESGACFVYGVSVAKRQYRVVSGALNPNVYTDEVVEYLKNALGDNPGLTVRILVGPRVECKGQRAANPLWQLSSSNDFSGRLQLRVLAGYPEQHFRVTDRSGLYVEEKHKEGSSFRNVSSFYPSFINAGIFAEHFDRAWEQTDAARKPEFKVVLRSDLKTAAGFRDDSSGSSGSH